MASIGNDKSVLSKNTSKKNQNVKKSNLVATINTTENGKNAALDISGFSDTITEGRYANKVGGVSGNKTGSTTTVTVPAAASTITVETPAKVANSDVDTILGDIKTHLDRFDTIGNDFKDLPTRVDSLKVGTNEIGVQCMLHYLSIDEIFLEKAKDQCSATLAKYGGGKSLDLTQLIKLSEDKKEFLADNAFYKNLYAFNLSMVDFISKDVNGDLKNASIETQKNLLDNLQRFIKQSLSYISDYMKKYQVIDDNLLISSTNLLFLLNKLSLRRVNITGDITKVSALHDKMIKTINENLALYNSLYNKTNIDKIAANVNITAKGPNANDLAKLSEKLEARTKILEAEQAKLRTNLETVNKDAKNLEGFVTKDVKELAAKFTSTMSS